MRYVIDFAMLVGTGWLICWGIKRSIRESGLDGFLVKSALYFDYLAICLFVLLPQFPWRRMTSADDIHISIGSILFLALLTAVCMYLLESRRARPWLLEPVVKWPLCAAAGFIWLFLTGGAFVIFVAHAVGRI